MFDGPAYERQEAMFARTTMKQYLAGAAAAVMMTATFGSQATAASSDAPWKIQDVSGEARFLDQEKGAQAASAGTIMDAGDRVKTGADGRVVIARGEERITVSPSSEMGLPVENTGPYSTRILQNLGTILLKVQKQPNQHFEVQTPYMAAVVKGTTFTVSVGNKGAAVHVVEGAVQVADLAGQQVQLIRPGQTATRSSDSSAPVKVTGVGTAPAGKPDKAEVDSPAAKPDAKSGDAKAAPGSRGNAAAAAKGGPKGRSGPKIAKALGNLNLNVAAATNGLATGPGKSANAGQGKGKSAARSGGKGFAPATTRVPVNNLVAQATGNNGNGGGNGGGNANGNANGGGNGGGNANGNANGGGNGSGNGGGNGGGNGNGNGNGN
tara:strand:+ start:107723 stop:108862 length:1140 start_codon:yes stop_codon:yes gene_type:complete